MEQSCYIAEIQKNQINQMSVHSKEFKEKLDECYEKYKKDVNSSYWNYAYNVVSCFSDFENRIREEARKEFVKEELTLFSDSLKKELNKYPFWQKTEYDGINFVDSSRDEIIDKVLKDVLRDKGIRG